MEFRAISDAVLGLLDEVHVGVLTTIDEAGFPRSRWMTPVALPRLPGRLYAVSSRGFSKIREIEREPKVLWTVQSRTLERVGSFRGLARVVEEPGLAAEVLEAIGPRLQVFWSYSGGPKGLVVIETEIVSASMFWPLGAGLKEASRG